MSRYARDSRMARVPNHSTHAPDQGSHGARGAAFSPSQASKGTSPGGRHAPSSKSMGKKVMPPERIGKSKAAKSRTRTVVDAGSTDSHKSTQR